MGCRILLLNANRIYKEEIKIDIYDKKTNKLNRNFKSVFDDCLDLRYLKENKKIIIKEKPFDYTTDIVNVSFDYKDNEKTTKEIRDILYRNGFILNGKKYVRYKRSSGSSRKGQCLFIKKDLYNFINKWSLCGIDESSEIVRNDLVSFEAYKALSLSEIEKVIQIEPKNILIIKDAYSIFKEKGIKVSNKDGELVPEICDCEIKNCIWDGEGLLDESVFNENDYSDKGMMLLRNRFFKSCVFNTKLQKWFKDNHITSFDQLNYSYTEAKSIEDIKLVVTESSIKYLKFGKIEDWIKHVDNKFGVVKTDKKTHFFDGEYVQTSYQFINTLCLSEQEVNELLKPSFDYIKKIQENIDVVRFYLESKSNNSFGKNKLDSDLSKEQYRNEIIISLLKMNRDFAYTKAYKNFKSDLQSSLRNKLKNGKILVRGNYSTLFGNGYEMLLDIIKKFDRNNPSAILPLNSVMSTKFLDDEELTCARSPHITMGNLYVVKNKIIKEYKEYFNLTNEIVCVNAIKENIQQRLNGCDYDSDTMLITNNQIILNAAKRNYDKFLVPVCNANPKKKELQKKYLPLTQIDYDIQQNLIGNIVNLSQYMNSILWEDLTNNPSVNVDEIYKDIAVLAVLSGMEIDKAKRDYGIRTNKELKRMDKYKKDKENKEPQFLHFIKNNEKKARYYNTAMDYVMKCVDYNKLSNESRIKDIPLSKIINKCKPSGGNCSKQSNRVIAIANSINDELNKIKAEFSSEDASIECINQDINQSLLNAQDKIHKELNNKYTIYLLLSCLEKDNNYKLTWIILYLLKNVNYDLFKEVFSKHDYKKFALTNDEDYDIQIYDLKYKLI